MPTRGRQLSFLVLALSALALYARTQSLSGGRTFPVWDEVEYLTMARDFRNLGGPLPAVGAYLRGGYREEGKHPLYPLLMAPFMDGTQTDYARAKLGSLACAFLLAALVFILSRRLWSEEAAVSSAALICLSPATAHLARGAMGDPLFAALYCASLLVLAGAGTSRARWLLFGVCAGLAYLAKGDGHVVFASAAAVGFAVFGKRFFTRPHFFIALAAFAAVTAFLLVRNERVWGRLFYNYNQPVLWMDQLRYAKIWRGKPEWETLCLRDYLATHTIGQIGERIGAGLKGFPHLLLQTMGCGPEDEPWRTIAGALLFGLALWGARARWRAGKKPEVLAVLTAGTILIGVFVWLFYLDRGVMRYVYPVAVSFLPVSAVGARALAPKLPAKFPGYGLIAASLAVLAGSYNGLMGNPLSYAGVSAHWHETSEWIREHVPPAGILTNANSPYSSWDVGLDASRPYCYDQPDADILDFAGRSGARYALLDLRVNSLDPARAKYGRLDAHGPVTFLGWPRCFHDSETPSVFLIYSPSCPKAGATKPSSGFPTTSTSPAWAAGCSAWRSTTTSGSRRR